MAEQPHVLVVDDDAKIAAALRRALIYEGYHVEVAPDGLIALARARERMPDLAILDVMMPGLDGLEVTRRLRAEGDLPILMLTAKDGTADRVRGLDSGADDYLVKPFAYEELLARVRALLRRRAPRARRTLRYADVLMDVGTREVRRADQLIEAVRVIASGEAMRPSPNSPQAISPSSGPMTETPSRWRMARRGSPRAAWSRPWSSRTCPRPALPPGTWAWARPTPRHFCASFSSSWRRRLKRQRRRRRSSHEVPLL